MYIMKAAALKGSSPSALHVPSACGSRLFDHGDLLLDPFDRAGQRLLLGGVQVKRHHAADSPSVYNRREGHGHVTETQSFGHLTPYGEHGVLVSQDAAQRAHQSRGDAVERRALLSHEAIVSVARPERHLIQRRLVVGNTARTAELLD